MVSSLLSPGGFPLLLFLLVSLQCWQRQVIGYIPSLHLATTYYPSERLSAFRLFSSISILHQGTGEIATNETRFQSHKIDYYHACLIVDSYITNETLNQEIKVMGGIGVRLWPIHRTNSNLVSKYIPSSLQCTLTIASQLFSPYGRYMDRIIFFHSSFVPVSLVAWINLLNSMDNLSIKDDIVCLPIQSITSPPLRRQAEEIVALGCDMSIHSLVGYSGHFLFDAIKSLSSNLIDSSILNMYSVLLQSLSSLGMNARPLLRPVIVYAGRIWSEPKEPFSMSQVLCVEFDGHFHNLTLIPESCSVQIGISSSNFNTVKILQDALLESIMKDSNETLVEQLSGCIPFNLSKMNGKASYRNKVILDPTKITRDILMRDIDPPEHFRHELKVGHDAYRRFLKSSYKELIADTAISSDQNAIQESIAIENDDKIQGFRKEIQKTLPRVVDVIYNQHSWRSMKDGPQQLSELIESIKQHIRGINQMIHYHIFLDILLEDGTEKDSWFQSMESNLQTLSHQFHNKLAIANMPNLPSPEKFQVQPSGNFNSTAFQTFLEAIEEVCRVILSAPSPTSTGMLVGEFNDFNIDGSTKKRIEQLDDWHFRTTDLIIVSCAELKISPAIVEDIQHRYKFRSQELRRKIGHDRKPKHWKPLILTTPPGENYNCPFAPFVLSVSELSKIASSLTRAEGEEKVTELQWYFQPSLANVINVSD